MLEAGTDHTPKGLFPHTQVTSGGQLLQGPDFYLSHQSFPKVPILCRWGLESWPSQ